MQRVNKIMESIEKTDKQVLPKRHRFKWSVKEILDLEREYTLLHMTYDEIADKHQRTVDSIILKIDEMKYEFEYDREEADNLNFKREYNNLCNDYSVNYNKLENEIKEFKKTKSKLLDKMSKDYTKINIYLFIYLLLLLILILIFLICGFLLINLIISYFIKLVTLYFIK